MRKAIHGHLAEEGWQKLSLAEQLGNIGSEVSRALKWQAKDEKLFWKAAERCLELFDLTLEDSRWRGRLKEITRAREVFCDALYGGKLYQSSLKDLIVYFDYFAWAARQPK